jgi:hypothetical protein
MHLEINVPRSDTLLYHVAAFLTAEDIFKINYRILKKRISNANLVSWRVHMNM